LPNKADAILLWIRSSVQLQRTADSKKKASVFAESYGATSKAQGEGSAPTACKRRGLILFLIRILLTKQVIWVTMLLQNKFQTASLNRRDLS
jgi:hypothetical protein